MSDTPPFFGESKEKTCQRWLGDHPCGAAAEFHIIWDDEMHNGIVCEEHALEAFRVWSPKDVHKANEACFHPDRGTRWVHEQQTCVFGTVEAP